MNRALRWIGISVGGLVAAYSADDFTRLLRTGKAIGDRELGVMSRWSRDNLSQLTSARSTRTSMRWRTRR